MHEIGPTCLVFSFLFFSRVLKSIDLRGNKLGDKGKGVIRDAAIYARTAFLSIPLGSLGAVAVSGKAYEGWWNHMSRLLPARPHDSLRRLTLRHHHRTMSTSWVALAVAR